MTRKGVSNGRVIEENGRGILISLHPNKIEKGKGGAHNNILCINDLFHTLKRTS